MRDHTKSLRRRLITSSAIAAGGVLAATMVVPSYGGDTQDESLKAAYDRAAQARALDLDPADPEDADALAHLDGTSPDGHDHDHSDPATKNSLSRTVADGTGSVDPATMDPTTPTQARRGVRTVAAQRAEPDPELVPAPKPPTRRDVPQNRYAMAGGCYVMKAEGGWVSGGGTEYALTGDQAQAMPFHFQATDLGDYLLVDKAGLFVGTGGGPTTSASETTVWTARGTKGRYTFEGPSGSLRGDGDSLTTGDSGSRFALRLTSGCFDWPEVDVNIAGRPFAGTSTFQEVRGTTDAHTHGMAYEFLGGGAHCGKPWSPFGVEVALVDCPDHSTTGGYGAVLESLMSGEPSHDPVGWPTFVDWPAPNSLTHEGTYWKWMERAWRGGMRLFVNLLVENNQLCMIYPIKGENFPQHMCDDMKSIELQAQRMREFERYIDAQYGGPGKGWYRIVKNPFQARKVINRGKLAVVMGIETSVPFGCSTIVDVPECSKEEIDAQLKKAHRMGVRQMELVNKFDNALSGVAGDAGEIGVLVNGANFLETQSFWDMRKCATEDPEVADKEQYATPEDGGAFEQRDGLFAAIAEVSGVSLPALPLYGPAPHCNNRGLTDLGEHLIRSMVDKGMIFDPDHMSVKARQSSLDLLEELDYSGVISSHSWSTPDAYPRIYKLGGVVMPYAGDSTGFVEKWKRHLTWADPRYYFGFGYGADINGLGAQGDPRGADAENPVTYPFEGLGGVKVKKQVSGERVYDINVDGVAHYGLYPDWLEDLRKLGGEDIVTDMSRGAEAYLQMWERAQGVTNDACREPALAKRAKAFRGLPDGLSVTQVLKRMGQPHQRLDRTFTYCAAQGGALTRVKLRFDGKGRLL